MRRIAMWLAATGALLVLLLTLPTSRGASTGASHILAAGSSGGDGSSSTVTGAAVSTRYGVVQVQVLVQDGKVVSATAVAYPTGGRDGQISGLSIPVLQDETVSAQSAQIDTVSGATFTSQGYIGSLQDALDQAGL